MKQFSHWLSTALVAWLSLSSMAAWSQPASCSAPGKDGIAFSAPSYYPGNGSVPIGSSNLTLGTLRTGAGPGGGVPGTTPIAPGDLVMIIQMQDALYNNGNGIQYGNGTTGRGWTALNNSGKYEFRRVVAFNAGTGALTIDQGLSFTYTDAAPSAGTGAAENGNRRFQVIRVPQFSSITLPANQSPPDWDGTTGGVWVIDVAGNLNMGGRTIDASARGFRAGGGWPNYYDNTGTTVNYVNTAAFSAALPASATCAAASTSDGVAVNVGAAKGEGIAGTPRLIRTLGAATGTYAATYSYSDLGGTGGYANGGFTARGAPGNAGGGGTQHNAGGGGGGGSNVGQGGIGGNSFAFYFATDQGGCVQLAPTFWGCTGDRARAMGGLGGGTLAASIDNLIMGGGGGAGDNNNACDNPTVPQAAGGNGGGIIFIRAGTISGAGNLLSNGQNALPGGRDAAGGGGAGGTVVVLTSTATPNLSIQANGGEGGNTGYSGTGGVAGTFLRAGETQGPGGGGGGGAVLRSTNISAFTSSTFAGGAGGRVFPVNGNTGISNPYGAGSAGGAASTVPFTPTSQNLVFNCLPVLAVTKRTTTPVVAFPDSNTAQYVVSIANTGPGTAVGATLSDVLPVPFQYAAATAPNNVIGLTYAGSAQGPANPTVGTGNTTLIVGTPGSSTTTTSFLLPPSTTVTFTVTVIVNGGGATPTLNFPFQNSATVGFLDPFRTAAATQVTPGTAYTGTTTVAGGANYASGSSTQEDVRVLGSVNIALTKTNSVTTLAAGQTTAYTITVANIGSFAATTVTLADPATTGLSCTAVTCQQLGTAVCPTVPNTTVALLQGAGIVIPNLPTASGSPPNNRLVFTVTCGVTATGQ